MLRQAPGQTLERAHNAPWYAALRERVPARILLLAGVVMFPLYITMDVIFSLVYDGYSYRDWTISELSAIGTDTRAGWLVFGVVYALLAWALAAGVLAVAGPRKRIRAIGWILVAYAVMQPLWWIAPMHQREALAAGAGDWHDTMHLALGAASSLMYFAMIGIAAFAFGRWFRWYSFATVGLMVVFGTLMNLHMENVSDNDPTPWLGIYERLAIEGAMLWMSVFAAVLLREARKKARPGGQL